MPILEGWEISPDRVDKFEKIMNEYPVGDPIITTKCKLDKEHGLLVASDSGFAWRIQMTAMRGGWASIGKNKWVRWYDIADIIPKKNGQILLMLKVRKGGALKLDGKGNPKIKKWKLTIERNKNETKPHFGQRQQYFNNIMSEIWARNKGDTDPATSDSKM